MKTQTTLAYRFICKVKITDTCWIWIGAKHEFGYGLIKKPGVNKNYKAHRLSYELFIGEIPERYYVLHKCDVPSCVNPKHLFLGTLSDNSKDMVEKGRGGGQFKKGHKLTEEEKINLSKRMKGNTYAKKI